MSKEMPLMLGLELQESVSEFTKGVCEVKMMKSKSKVTKKKDVGFISFFLCAPLEICVSRYNIGLV